VTAARVLKNRFLLAHPEAFYSLVGFEIDKATVLHGSDLRVRLNTFSDIAHENVAPWLLDNRPGVRFYDYTKGWDRNPPDNYRLTLSASERTTVDQITAAVGNGRNVAVVFPQSRVTPLPKTWHGLRVIDGDKTDNRADDPTGVVVGLRAKGSMRNEKKGMVKKWEYA
jgi:hypothetical protein